MYHQACSVNFRTGKQIPKKHGNDTDSKRAKGHPTDTVKSKAFFKKKTEVLVENDKEQFTISDLDKKMQEYLERAGETPVQCCIHERNVTETVNNRNVVTFRSTVATIISECYKQPKVDDYEVEQTRVTVACLKKVWVHHDIPDSARRSQQGRHLYSPNVSLLILQPLSTTSSGFTTRYTAVEKCWALATRLGSETSRWKTLPVRTAHQQLTCLC